MARCHCCGAGSPGAAIAGALDATLVLPTDVEGVYEDPGDPATLIESVETGVEWERPRSGRRGGPRRGLARGLTADANAEEPIISALKDGGTRLHVFALADAEEAGQ